jgi:apolipoprotein N-acyltransferase
LDSVAAAPAAHGDGANRWFDFAARRPWLRAWLWGLASALALPPMHLLPVLLFSIPGFLRLIGGASGWRQVALIGWMFGFGLNLGGLYWITEPMLTEVANFWWLVPFADPLLAFAVAFYSIFPAVAAFAVRPGVPRLLVFAGAWVLSDLARQFLFTGFPWNLWGTDWAVPGRIGDVFLQPAALAGVHGLTLATVLLAGLPLFGRRGFVVLLASLLAWGGFGLWRLTLPVAPTGISLALIQPNFPVPGLFDRASLESRWQRDLGMSAAGLKAGANAVIWPEAASPWLLDSDDAARQQLATVTGTAPVIAGSIRVVSDTDIRNSLVVINGPLPAVAVYDKWKLVPFGEYMPKWIPVKITPDVLGQGFTPGPGPATLHVPGLPPVAPLICYEAIFSGQVISRKDRPDWIVNITDDAWFGDSAGPRQHFADARLRAVEQGLPLARAANSGISAMFDAFGRVTAYLPLNSEGVLVTALPGHLPQTPYGRFGLRIPFLLGIGLIICGGFGGGKMVKTCKLSVYRLFFKAKLKV